MTLQEFFTAGAHEVCTTHTKFILVAPDEPPLLFSSLLCHKLRSSGVPVVRLDLATHKQQDIRAQLETSFLGSWNYFWLDAFDTLTPKKRAEWLAYICSYTGPNRIVISLTQKHAPKEVFKEPATLVIPEKLNKYAYTSLFSYAMRPPTAMDMRRIDELFVRTDQIPFERACLLLAYQRLLGGHAKEFFDSWLDRLVVPQSSLFHLSQHLFAKKSTLFVRSWTRLADQYAPQFWLAYWSDQVWRAIWYCRSMHNKQIAQAKKIGYRLPFSFLQKDYRRYQPGELGALHQALYDLDYDLKHGGNPLGLELIFYRFFTDGFK